VILSLLLPKKAASPKFSDPLSFYFQKTASSLFLHPKNNGGYGKTFGDKKQDFWVETFSIYQKMGLHPVSSKLLV